MIPIAIVNTQVEKEAILRYPSLIFIIIVHYFLSFVKLYILARICEHFQIFLLPSSVEILFCIPATPGREAHAPS